MYKKNSIATVWCRGGDSCYVHACLPWDETYKRIMLAKTRSLSPSTCHRGCSHIVWVLVVTVICLQVAVDHTHQAWPRAEHLKFATRRYCSFLADSLCELASGEVLASVSIPVLPWRFSWFVRRPEHQIRSIMTRMRSWPSLTRSGNGSTRTARRWASC